MQYNILNTIYNKEKKLKFLNTKYFISKIIYKIKKFLVNKSSFKFKKVENGTLQKKLEIAFVLIEVH